MLIIEGGDLVGKTTFCKALLKHEVLQRLGHIYSHFSRLPDGWRHPWGYFDHARFHTVQDRFHMSEPVYAFARGDKTQLLSPEGYRLVDGLCRLNGAFTVVIYQEDDGIIRKRHAEREEMYDLDVTVGANQLFRQIAVTGGRLQNYTMDVDHVIRCDEHKLFPNENDLHAVMQAYTARISLLSHKGINTWVYQKH